MTAIGETQFDVIVVGGGGSGLAAAIEAARAGGKVVVLEKNSEPRGSTGMSVGSITSSQTDLQRRQGVFDTPAEHDADMEIFARMRGAPDNLELRRILINEVPQTVRWLTSLGVVFFGPMAEPPHKKPRMHNVLPNSAAYIYFLSKECRRLGVQFIVNARVQTFLKRNNEIVGVRAQVEGSELELQARNGVILATGDYNGAGDMRDTYTTANPQIEGVNSNLGDGQRLGVEEGSEVLNGDVVWGPLLRLLPPQRSHPFSRLPPWRGLTLLMRFALERFSPVVLRPFIMSFVTTFISPDKGLFREGAILINRSGKRFTEETDRPAVELPLQSDKRAFIVMGSDVVQKFSKWPHYVSTAPGVAYAYLPDYKCTRKDVYFEADSVPELASQLGVDPVALQETIDAYNQQLSLGQLSNRSDTIRPLAGPRFCALGPIESRIVMTDGGLKVNTQHQVLRKDGSVVKGLYAVGSVGQGGLLLEGHGHHLGWAFTSGRRAGCLVMGATWPVGL